MAACPTKQKYPCGGENRRGTFHIRAQAGVQNRCTAGRAYSLVRPFRSNTVDVISRTEGFRWMEKVNCQDTAYFPYERSFYCKLLESVLIRELAKTPAKKDCPGRYGLPEQCTFRFFASGRTEGGLSAAQALKNRCFFRFRWAASLCISCKQQRMDEILGTGCS